MTSRRTRNRSRTASPGERPPLHPLLTFQFGSDVGTPAEPKQRSRRARHEPPASIADAIARWLDEQL